MNEFKDNQDLVCLLIFIYLRSRKKKNCDGQFSLDWDNDRYQDGANQIIHQLLNHQQLSLIGILFRKIKLEFELVTKVALMVATERIRKFLDNIISYEIYGKLPDENVHMNNI
ncbi:unnamed protein product [Rotaria socialis]|uniref:Uncharacterized protein n=1 Tax=Rotaria socialis TaxID=392032 RepID=A0A817UX64_9BILA|nr:unnamed protein product [Rotaria socialis]